jgi:hypothetical protein
VSILDSLANTDVMTVREVAEHLKVKVLPKR